LSGALLKLMRGSVRVGLARFS